MLIACIIIINSCAHYKMVKKQDSSKTDSEQIDGIVKLDSLDIFRLNCGQPIGPNWKMDIGGTWDASYINYVKSGTVKKELSILIFASDEKDVTDESIQNKAISRFPTLSKIDDRFITMDYGAKAFVFKGQSKPIGNETNYIYSILSYANNVEYNITLSCYSRPVELDKEMSLILKYIEILKESNVENIEKEIESIDFKTKQECLELQKMEFGQPFGEDWHKDIQESSGFLVLNYVKRAPIKKELSILIIKSDKRDISLESVQNRAISKILSLSMVEEKDISSDFGVNAFVFKGQSKLSNDKVNNFFSILANANGFEYNIVLSCYSKPVELDEELLEILKFIKIKE